YMPDGEKVAEVIQKNLADVGITAEIVTHEWATYLELAEKGDADAFMLGWTGDNGDADNFIYALLDEDNIGSNNYTYFKNDEMHDLLIDAQTEVDEEKRIEMYKESQEIINEEAPWVPIAHSTPLLGGASDITGFLPHPTGSDLLSEVDLSYWIDKKKERGVFSNFPPFLFYTLYEAHYLNYKSYYIRQRGEEMLRYIIQRLLQLIPVLFGMTFIVFMIIRAIPGNPAQVILGQQA